MTRLGPVTARQLKQLADEGVISPESLIWKEGLPDWIPASKAKGLFAARGPAPERAPTETPFDQGIYGVEPGPSSPGDAQGRKWYYVFNGQQVGPVSKGALSDLARAGTVTRDTFVWSDGMPDWKPMHSVKELAVCLAQAGVAPLAASGSFRTLEPHRGGLILTFGILGILCCLIFAIIAWVMGHNDLKEMDAGRKDPSGRGLTKAGMILGIVGVCLAIFGAVIQAILAASGGQFP